MDNDDDNEGDGDDDDDELSAEALFALSPVELFDAALSLLAPDSLEHSVLMCRKAECLVQSLRWVHTREAKTWSRGCCSHNRTFCYCCCC